MTQPTFPPVTVAAARARRLIRRQSVPAPSRCTIPSSESRAGRRAAPPSRLAPSARRARARPARQQATATFFRTSMITFDFDLLRGIGLSEALAERAHDAADDETRRRRCRRSAAAPRR